MPELTGARPALAPLPAAAIRVEGFEGPLELLLHLLDQRQLEITAISLVAVTDQYLAYVRLLPAGPPALEALAEFLVVAAHLLLLKSRALLPRERAATAADDEVDAETLEQRLAEYRHYRAAAARLGERQERGERAFSRQAPPPLPPAPPPRLEAAAPEQLAQALQRLLAARAPAQQGPQPAPAPRVTLAERIREVHAAVETHGRVSFAWLAAGCASRADLIITFLAILELYRAREIGLEQDALFGEIWLGRAAAPRVPDAPHGGGGTAESSG